MSEKVISFYYFQNRLCWRSKIFFVFFFKNYFSQTAWHDKVESWGFLACLAKHRFFKKKLKQYLKNTGFLRARNFSKKWGNSLVPYFNLRIAIKIFWKEISLRGLVAFRRGTSANFQHFFCCLIKRHCFHFHL